MGFLSEYFGEKKYLNMADKEDEKKKKKASRPDTADGTSRSNTKTQETITDLLENDWFTFSTINVVAAQFAKPPIKLVTQDEDTWNTFFENMRYYGNTSSIKRLLEELKRDASGYGAGYVEFIPDEDGESIVDLKRVDAGKIRHAKDNQNRLILDDEGKSIGFVVDLGPNADTRGKGNIVPPKFADSIHMSNSEIFLLPSKIAMIPLYTKGNGIEPMGLVEAAIEQTKRRQKLEDAQVNAIWIRGTAPLFGLVGDPQHEPTGGMLEDALDSLEEMKHSNVTAFPYYYEPKTIDAKVDDNTSKVMEGLMYASAGAAGTPLPFVTGAGEATNRSTLKTQREIFEANIQQKIDNFDEDFNLKVLKKIAAVNGYKDAHIESGSVRLEAKDEFAKRIKIFADLGVISPKEIRETLKDFEDIKFDDTAFEEYNKEKKDMLEKEQENKEQEEGKDKDEEEPDKTEKKDKEEEKQDNNTTKK